MAAQFEVVMDAHADATIAREVARPGSMTQRALSGWVTEAGVSSSGSVTGYTDHGDGTATLTFGESSGVTMTKSQDGTTAELTFTS